MNLVAVIFVYLITHPGRPITLVSGGCVNAGT